MVVKLNKKVAVVQRRQKVADLYVQGWTQTAIGHQLAINQTTDCRDLQAIQAEWRGSSLRDFDLARQVEVQKLDRIEREAWAAWERSQKPSQSADLAEGSTNRPARKRIKNQYGDPRFLSVVMQAVANRQTLLGLDSPKRTEITGKDGAPIEVVQDNPVLQEERFRELMKLLNRARERERAGATIGPDGKVHYPPHAKAFAVMDPDAAEYERGM